MDNLLLGTLLPINDDLGNPISIGDKLNVKFGNSYTRYIHENVEVYFDNETLQVCVRGGNIKSKLKSSLVGYVNPSFEIIEKYLSKHPY